MYIDGKTFRRLCDKLSLFNPVSDFYDRNGRSADMLAAKYINFRKPVYKSIIGLFCGAFFVKIATKKINVTILQRFCYTLVTKKR